MSATISETLYARYIKENFDYDVIENESSFIIYKQSGDEVFIAELFVEAGARDKGHCKSLLAALSNKCSGAKFMTGNIFLTKKNANETLIAALKCGFKVERAEGDRLFIVKHLSEGD